jgi:hypothetical protein
MNLDGRLKFNYRNNGVSFIEKDINKFSSTYDNWPLQRGFEFNQEKDMQRKNTVKKTRLVIKVAAGKIPYVMRSTSGIN